MQKSFDRSTWIEDKEREREREGLERQSDAVRVRELFPFKAKALKRLVAYGIGEGTLFEYARCREEIAFYPIIVMVGVANDAKNLHPRKLYFTSDEVQLLEA